MVLPCRSSITSLVGCSPRLQTVILDLRIAVVDPFIINVWIYKHLVRGAEQEGRRAWEIVGDRALRTLTLDVPTCVHTPAAKESTKLEMYGEIEGDELFGSLRLLYLDKTVPVRLLRGVPLLRHSLVHA